MASEAILVQNLTRKFKELVAVDNISFSVHQGELFGLLGPNGAGKTTTINVLATLLEPTSGNAAVAGFDVAKSQGDVRKHIGIVFQEPALDTKLTGRENLEFHAMMYKIPKVERKRRIADVLSLVELTDKADVLVENYSGGMKRRLEIARGLIHEPAVLFLDEPTLGLDSQTRRLIWDYIKKLNKERGVTIILTTHYMEEADFLCDRVAIIDHGKIVVLDTPAKLKDALGGDVVCLEVNDEQETLLNRMRSLEWIKAAKHYNGCNLSLTMEKAETRIPEIVSIAEQDKAKITSVSIRKPSLEDAFLHFTGRTIREQEASQDDKNRRVLRMRMRRW